MKVQAKEDPLAPIATAVAALTALLVVGFVVTLAATVFGSGSLLGFGGPATVCATANTGTVGYQGSDDPNGNGVVGLRHGARQVERIVDICLDHPGAAARWEQALGLGASLLFLIGAVVLTRRIIGSARRHGLFSEVVAARTRVLGWFLVLGSLASAFLESVSAGLVITHAVRNQTWTVGLGTFDMPWTLLLVGLGVISVARVLGRAVSMQDDLDTVI